MGKMSRVTPKILVFYYKMSDDNFMEMKRVGQESDVKISREQIMSSVLDKLTECAFQT